MSSLSAAREYDASHARSGAALQPVLPLVDLPSYKVKRTIDRGLVLVSLPLVMPIMALVALVVVATSKGPALFRQERIGLHGRRFTMLKFRTMQVDAESRLAEVLAENGQEIKPFYKLKRDPRVTRVGSLLRKTSLDELPQLFNVLRGDMSLFDPVLGLAGTYVR